MRALARLRIIRYRLMIWMSRSEIISKLFKTWFTSNSLIIFSALLICDSRVFAVTPSDTSLVRDDTAYWTQREGIELSWTGGILIEPNTGIQLNIKNPKLEGKFPVVIYLHGCDGINLNHDTLWARYIAKLGFAVILPNSFSRPKRISNCNPLIKSGTGRFPAADVYRQEEIAYAITRLKKESWVDSKKIYLMGHSEGGRAAALANFKDLRGIIISAWQCTSRQYPLSDGIKSDMSIPVLALIYDEDPWYFGTPNQGDCAKHGGARLDFSQKLFKGKFHQTYDNSEARLAVTEFLKRISNQ